MNLALFDFDHTLTRVDTYGRFLRTIATPRQLSEAKWKVGPWLAGYRLGLVSAAALRGRVTRLAFQGGSQQEVMRHGKTFASEVLAGVMRPDMLRRLQQHQSQGDEVVIVSGSLDAYLQPWCAQHGLALLCNRLESKDGILTGRYEAGDCGATRWHASTHAMTCRAMRTSPRTVTAARTCPCWHWRRNAGIAGAALPEAGYPSQPTTGRRKRSQATHAT